MLKGGKNSKLEPIPERIPPGSGGFLYERRLVACNIDP
jgi:hypothetical protein